MKCPFKPGDIVIHQGFKWKITKTNYRFDVPDASAITFYPMETISIFTKGREYWGRWDSDVTLYSRSITRNIPWL